jgi:hypothetical protein
MIAAYVDATAAAACSSLPSRSPAGGRGGNQGDQLADILISMLNISMLVK